MQLTGFCKKNGQKCNQAQARKGGQLCKYLTLVSEARDVVIAISFFVVFFYISILLYHFCQLSNQIISFSSMQKTATNFNGVFLLLCMIKHYFWLEGSFELFIFLSIFLAHSTLQGYNSSSKQLESWD